MTMAEVFQDPVPNVEDQKELYKHWSSYAYILMMEINF